MQYQDPSDCGLTRAQVEAFAEALADHMGFSPGDSVRELANRLGGTVHYEDIWDLDRTKDGSIQVHGEGKFDIFLPLHTGEARDRFTIAHELGHYFLHYVYKKADLSGMGLKARRAGTGKIEWQANWFAAALLMPKAKFSSAFSAYGGNISTLADEFGVSEAAARVRAEVLGLI